MKYQKGDFVEIMNGSGMGQRGIVTIVEDPPTDTLPYRVDCDTAFYWTMEEYLKPDELQQLRAENEHLKAALETIDAEISQWSQVQAPPEADTCVALIARIESLVSEALEPDE